MAVQKVNIPPGVRTIPDMFRNAVERYGNRVMMREKEMGLWKAYTWNQTWKLVQEAGNGLIALGFEVGDCISILSNNNPEWIISDLGALCAGGVSSGIYPTDAVKQVQYLLDDSKSKYVFVEDEEQLDKVLEARANTPTLSKIIVFDMEGLRDLDDSMVLSWSDLLALGRKYAADNPTVWEERLKSRNAEDLAVLVYTSGTTGPPKGAMLSHHNIVFNSYGQALIYPLDDFQERLSFLPLCHVGERALGYYNGIVKGFVMNFVESPETIPENIREVAPTWFGSVPRVWEKFYSAVTIMIAEATWSQRKSYELAIYLGLKRVNLEQQQGPIPVWLRMATWIGTNILLRNVRKAIGVDRCEFAVSGAAPISPDLIRWYRAMGLELFEIYGQTENTGLATTNIPGANRVGSVGRSVPYGEIKISDQGEILIRGDHVFMGYLNLPEKTAETVIDGWLHTGDVGKIDEDGYVYITDRMKDIIITAGGKNITPSEIENQLKFSPYITDAVVIGDQRKFLSCLVMIDQDNVAKYAQDNDVPFTDYASLCRAEAVVQLIDNEIEKVNKNFAQVETIKKFRLIDKLLTPEDEELTPTMKLKRSFVNKSYKTLIDSMYKGA